MSVSFSAKKSFGVFLIGALIVLFSALSVIFAFESEGVNLSVETANAISGSSTTYKYYKQSANESSQTEISSKYSSSRYTVSHPSVSTSLSATALENGAPVDDPEFFITLDLSGDAWMSNLAVNNDSSLLGKLGVVLNKSGYTYYSYAEFYSDEGSTWLVSQGVDNPAQTDNIVGTTQDYLPLNSNSITSVSAIYFSGTTWYGESVSSFNVLANDGKNLVAGIYTVDKIVFNYDINYTYTDCIVLKRTNTKVIGQSDMTFDEVQTIYTVSVKETGSIQLNLGNVQVVCTTDVTVGIGMADRLNNNLGLHSVYTPGVKLDDRVSLYDENVSDNPEGSEAFYYSLGNGSRNIFRSSTGLFADMEKNTDFNLGMTTPTGDKIADLLKISFYSDIVCTMDIDTNDETSQNAGIYFFRIEGNTEYSEKVYNGGTSKIFMLNFKPVGASGAYVQKIVVNPRELKISIKDSHGIKLNENDKGIATAPYRSQYTSYMFLEADEGKRLNEFSETFYKSDHTIFEDTSVTVDFAQDYYVRKSPIGDIVSNNITSEAEWLAIGGFEGDYETVLAGSGLVFGWEGSTFPGYEIKSYTYINLNLYVQIAELAKNYSIDFGEYVSGEWKSYSEEENQNKTHIIESGKTYDGISVMKRYMLFGQFAMTPPAVEVSLSSFSNSISGAYYGEVFDGSDIDFSTVELLGGNINKISQGLYTLETSAPNWRIKIISEDKEKRENIDNNYNYIFVQMVLGTKSDKTDKSSSPSLYQDEDGVIYDVVPFGQVFYVNSYYVYCTLSYKLAGTTTSAVSVDGMTLGMQDVIVSGAGISTITLVAPATFDIWQVGLYTDMTEYTLDKYYDGTDSVKRSSNSTQNAAYVIKQDLPEGYTISPGLQSKVQNKVITSILEYDEAMYVYFTSSIFYSNKGVSSDMVWDSTTGKWSGSKWAISCTTEINPLNDVARDIYDAIVRSYSINNELYVNGAKPETVEGLIYPRKLEMYILNNPDRITDVTDPNYSSMEYQRSYMDNDYAAIRVAKYSDVNSEGMDLLSVYTQAYGTPAKTYYADYYFFFNQVENTYGYYFYHDLPGLFDEDGNRTKVCYMLMEIEGKSNKSNYGFLNTSSREEGFDWDESDYSLHAFNVDEYDTRTEVEPYRYIDWSNTKKMDAATGEYNDLSAEMADIARVTEWSAGFYHLPMRTGFLITNYWVEFSSELSINEYIPLEITRIQLNPEDVFEVQEPDLNKGRTLIYDNTPKIDVVYTSDTDKTFILIEKHRDVENIYGDTTYQTEAGISNFKSLIKIIGFTYNLEEEENNPIEVEPDNFNENITKMIYAGEYILEVSTPETENYKKVTTTVTLRVYCAEITVFSTIATRTYMSEYDENKEVRLAPDASAEKFMTLEELNNYRAYIDRNTYEIFPSNNDRIETYVYFKDDNIATGIYDTSYIHLYYVGLAFGDEFTDDDVKAVLETDNSCFFNDAKDVYEDVAGRKDEFISIYGAKKRNYKFNYVAGALYVKKQTLILNINGNQSKIYSGDNLSPSAIISTEEGVGTAPAALKQFIAAYYVWNENDGKYDLYMRDLSDVSVLTLREAEMSLGSSDAEEKDYYFYFESFTNKLTDAPVNVVREGDRLYFTDGGETITVYAIGTKYYYYPNNDREQSRIELGMKQTNIYLDDVLGTYYYLDDLSNKVTISVTPDFNKVENGAKTLHIDEVDGKRIYLGINEDTDASTKDNVVKNVFALNGQTGGYVLKVYADPDERQGGKATNYERTQTQTIFFGVDILEIELIDHDMYDYQGNEVNPFWESTFLDEEYALNEFKEYYFGVDSDGNQVNLKADWADIEVYEEENVKRFYYDSSEEEANLVEYGRTSFGKYVAGEETELRLAQSTSDIIKNAGIYIILIKTKLNASYTGDGYPVDMGNNIRFKQRLTQTPFDGSVLTPSGESEAYFVLFLVMNRSANVSLFINTSDSVDAKDTDGDGVIDRYEKTYDAQTISFGENLTVFGKPSSEGQILATRAYMSTGNDYKRNSILYFITENGALVYKWNNENTLVNLIHANQFYMTVIVNYDDRIEAAEEGRADTTYNNNFETVVQVFQVEIMPRALRISILIRDPDTNDYVEPDATNCGKNFGQKNSEVEGKFGYEYSNWVGGDEAFLLTKIVPPTINWVNVSSDDDPEGQRKSVGAYGITSMGGVEPTTVVVLGGREISFNDYAFDYSGSRDFYIYPLKLTLDENTLPRVEIDKSGTYAGEALKPVIYVRGWNGEIVFFRNDNSNDLQIEVSKDYHEDFDDISITLLGRINNYIPGRTYTFEDANDETIVEKIGSNAINCGFYLFRIHVGDSFEGNYEGLDSEVAWVFEIEKAELTLYFVNGAGEEDRGSSSMVYVGTPGTYPTFNVRYTGFCGEDNTAENRSIQKVAYGKNTIATTPALPLLNLYNPIYVFVNGDTGEELFAPDGETAFMPVNAGVYYIKLLFGNNYGYSDNYKIVAKYSEDEHTGGILYPILNITKRPVGVLYTDGVNSKITKEFDGTNTIRDGSIVASRENSVGNYSFSGVTADNTGLIPGDNISLKITYSGSYYERSTVFDEFNEQSDINVFILIDANLIGTDADNYVFSYDISAQYGSTQEIEGVMYIKLVGRITQAKATIRFYNANGQAVTTNTVTYTGEQQSAIVRVEGVGGELLTMENGDYTVWYNSDKSNWDSDIAPTNCDLYEVTVTITNKNYLETPSTSFLSIEQAEVDIIFGGEGVQTYGDVSIGLTAIATGVHGYNVVLSVNYYYLNADGTKGDLIEDISLAPTGTYHAEAIHFATDNFKEKRSFETFTIARRTMAISSDVPTGLTYTGKAFTIKIYFVDNGHEYRPQLLFDKAVNGLWVPQNYTIIDGEVFDIGAYPSNAGEYRVRAYEIFGNYYISDTEWRQFSVNKADLTVQTNDVVVNEGESFAMTSTMLNCLTSDSILNVVKNIGYKYYNAVSGDEISLPSAPGTYRVIGYGATSENYNISYKFGLLTINKKSVAVSTNKGTTNESSAPQIVFEGSFSADITINVSIAQSAEESTMTDSFNNFKDLNEEYKGYRLKNIYVFSYGQMTTNSQIGGTTIKIYMPELFTNAQSVQSDSAARFMRLANNDGVYYVAVLADDGTINVVKGYKEGDYLCVDTEEGVVVRALSVLTEDVSVSNQFDWMLYVGIAIAVLLIAVAIVIVAKKA